MESIAKPKSASKQQLLRLFVIADTSVVKKELRGLILGGEAC